MVSKPHHGEYEFILGEWKIVFTLGSSSLSFNVYICYFFFFFFFFCFSIQQIHILGATMLVYNIYSTCGVISFYICVFHTIDWEWFDYVYVCIFRIHVHTLLFVFEQVVKGSLGSLYQASSFFSLLFYVRYRFYISMNTLKIEKEERNGY